MGVIGRLDGQVDEIIIKPVGERGRQESGKTPGPSQGTSRPVQTERLEDRSEDEKAEDVRSSELPVWLL